jgi:hypothetical protein
MRFMELIRLLFYLSPIKFIQTPKSDEENYSRKHYAYFNSTI